MQLFSAAMVNHNQLYSGVQSMQSGLQTYYMALLFATYNYSMLQHLASNPTHCKI